MDAIKKHIDTIIILSAFASSILWINAQFSKMDGRFAEIEKDIAIIKTVLIMKNIMPVEIARGGE